MRERKGARSSLTYPERLEHALKVQSKGFRVKVGVVLDVKACIAKDTTVIDPSGIGDQDSVDGVEFGKEGGTQGVGSGTRDGLDGSGMSLPKDRTILAEDETHGGLPQGRETRNGKVLVIKGGVVQDELPGLDEWMSDGKKHTLLPPGVSTLRTTGSTQGFPASSR